MTRPYENIKILDLTHILAGPFATYQFALLGADVIKIEPPTMPDPARGRGPDKAQNDALKGLNYQVQASNKKAITLDLKQTAGRKILLKLVQSADILVENYRSGALDELGLGYDDLKAANPKLIYCSLSGFGNYGDRAEVNAYDNVIQATSGIIEQSGGHKPGVSFVDYAAGYNAAFAISAALHRREKTGQGTYISSSMLEVAMTLMAPEAAAAKHPVKIKRDKEAGISSYETSSGILMIGAFTPDQNRRMWEMLECEGYNDVEDLKDTADWESLWHQSKEIKATLAEIFKSDTAANWQDIFHNYGLPAERQRTLDEAVTDPQLENYFKDVDGVTLPSAAYQFEDGPEIISAPPGFSEHSEEILSSLGYSDEEIEQLREEGVIA
ncbi:MAG: CoA transferase [Kordiimonadaceae bacterium]|jgi:crotonobetainyl-CoA:carnitine CoA-transferase CaiB-like acyl-CoA transferase|nr:CoA transferase [Kordiimonadaceae bacterium]MBT6037462.1 CoA transferase [Kordiimonadaceae bacterium]MBT6328586.1 CoA transferase [Kordiimonadaceae bacterium]